jgi:hypothetical protein
MATIIIIVIAVLLAGFLGFAATRPDTFRVQRSASIKAPPQKIVALIDDFHNWTSWSPWEKLDPGLKRTYGGAASGRGAVYEWEGNRKAGQGRMEVMETSPSGVIIKLDFLKPFEAHNTAEFALQPGGDSTSVTWAMYGPNAYLSKVMSLIFNMDKMIGKDFEAGLANLKTVAERGT